jgi:hypothetical protein
MSSKPREPSGRITATRSPILSSVIRLVEPSSSDTVASDGKQGSQ